MNTDLRAFPAFIITYSTLSIGFLGIFIAVFGSLHGWPVSSKDALAAGGILASIGLGIGVAFFKRRREWFRKYGKLNSVKPTFFQRFLVMLGVAKRK